MPRPTANLRGQRPGARRFHGFFLNMHPMRKRLTGCRHICELASLRAARFWSTPRCVCMHPPLQSCLLLVDMHWLRHASSWAKIAATQTPSLSAAGDREGPRPQSLVPRSACSWGPVGFQGPFASSISISPLAASFPSHARSAPTPQIGILSSIGLSAIPAVWHTLAATHHLIFVHVTIIDNNSFIALYKRSIRQSNVKQKLLSKDSCILLQCAKVWGVTSCAHDNSTRTNRKSAI